MLEFELSVTSRKIVKQTQKFNTTLEGGISFTKQEIPLCASDFKRKNNFEMFLPYYFNTILMICEKEGLLSNGEIEKFCNRVVDNTTEYIELKQKERTLTKKDIKQHNYHGLIRILTAAIRQNRENLLPIFNSRTVYLLGELVGPINQFKMLEKP